MKTIILAGGLGTRLGQITETIPKPMVLIGGRPILWHIMKIYSYHGFNEFIISLGVKADVIRNYFYEYEIINNDFTKDMSSGRIEYHNSHDESNWKITLADTGQDTLELEPLADERGFFARTFCCREFEKLGLNTHIAQCSLSYNKKKGTLRGMHYQVAPHEEAKLINCSRGSVYDVIIDLRHDSPTYCRWLAVELSAENYTMLYVPEGFAHGFQTLENDTVVNYQISEFYHPECAKGLRWDDPAFNIKWPFKPAVISEKDKGYPDFKPADK